MDHLTLLPPELLDIIALGLDRGSDLLSLSMSCKALKAVVQSVHFQATWLHRWEPETCTQLALRSICPADVLKQLIEVYGVDVNQRFPYPFWDADGSLWRPSLPPKASFGTALHLLCMTKFSDAMGDAIRCVRWV